MSRSLAQILEESAGRHSHLCPRQVLGARMALAALEWLGISAPISKQSALVILETDGCFADGIEVASGATVGHRTLRINDIGKIAAVFADARSGAAIRLAPRPDARLRARLYAPNEERHYFAQLAGYQVMPTEELFRVQEVLLDPPLDFLLSKPGIRVACEVCGEEIINEREITLGGKVLCRSCARGAYYRPALPRRSAIRIVTAPSVSAELLGT